MGIAEKYNKRIRNPFTFVAGKDFAYKSLGDLYNEKGEDFVHLLKGVFINNKTLYTNETTGLRESPVAVSSDCYVNLPAHLVSAVKEMLEDDEFITAVNNNKVGFHIYKYYTEKRPNQPCYSISFIDL